MINAIQKKQSDFSKVAVPVASTIGGIIGSIIPGAGTLAGAAAGSAIGGAVGGIAKGVADKDLGEAAAGVTSGLSSAASLGKASPADAGSAMQRRLDTSQPVAPAAQQPSPEVGAIQEGREALTQLPEEQRQLYGPPLDEAYRLAMRRSFARGN